MKTVELRWAVKEPGKEVEDRKIKINYKNEDDRSSQELKLAQGLVDGYVEVVWIGGDVKALVNEEAMYKPNMEDNCGFLGTIVFFRGDSEDFASLTDEDVRKIEKWCKVHDTDRHPMSSDVKVLTGVAAEEYRARLELHRQSQQLEWDSF